jgi:hypothetical protein
MTDRKKDRLDRARNIGNGAAQLPEISTLDEIIQRITALEIKSEFIDESKWGEYDLESPWDDICLRHGVMSYMAGARDCPYPKETHAARRWNAGYMFSSYWQSIVTDELKDAAKELETIRYASTEWEDL